MMRIFLTLLFLSTILSTSYAQKSLNLEQAISIALNRNTILQKTQNNLEVTNSQIRAAYGNFLPSLSANAGWNWNRSEDAGGSINIGGTVIPVPPSTSESRNYNGRIGASLTLFDGLSNFATLSKSKNDLESAKLSLQRLKQDIVFQTITFYYNVLIAKELLKVRKDDLKWNKRNLETITERNNLGAVTLADVYAQQVKEGNSELALIQANNSYETTKSNLLNYLALDVLDDYDFSDTFTDNEKKLLGSSLTTKLDDLSTLVSEALNTRKDYKSAKLALKSANNSITIAKAGHMPTLTNSFSYNVRSNRFENYFDSRTYFVGLNFSLPLFSGFRISNNVQFAEINLENKEIDLTDLERSIKLKIQKTYLDLKAAEKSLAVNKRNVKASEENRKIEQERYSLGAGTLLNVLIANSSFTTARKNFITSQFEYLRLSKQLKYYLGVLDYKKYE